MNKAELEGWFETAFWPAYKQLVKTPFPTKYKQGTKGSALKKILSLNPSEELRERIMAALGAQIRHRRSLYESLGSEQAYIEYTAYNRFYTNRHGETWINQMGWTDEIPSIQEVNEERLATGLIHTCGHVDKRTGEVCQNQAIGPSVPYCVTHYPDTRGYTALLREKYREMGLVKGKGETSPQHMKRMIATCREMIGRIGKI